MLSAFALAACKDNTQAQLEYIADILPSGARQLESAKEKLLALFRSHGYELVHPPLMEYSDSLLTHIDSGLSLKTIRFVDQISGRQLGIRADITPQVARIDVHLLSANQGINRQIGRAHV